MDIPPDEYFFRDYPFLMELIAGGCCGLAVDICLFPVDTCKTRLQSENGFWKSGGFKDIYNGLAPVVAASAPIAAIFFCVYATVKNLFADDTVEYSFFTSFLINLLAASLGEMCADLIRVPTEIVKQKRQVSEVQFRAVDILMKAYKTDGLINGVYRGYGITIMRDIPFSMIQYPLWELMKSATPMLSGNKLRVFIDACYGSVAGAVAAAITTPLDAAKTRIQLSDTSEEDLASRNPIHVWQQLYKENGISGLFGGFVPRVLWTTIGGFIWFGTYSLVIFLLKML